MDSNSQKIPHGAFEGRLYLYSLLPRGTDEPQGYTKWHLLASGLLDQDQFLIFIGSMHDESTNTLLDDAREHMAVYPIEVREWFDYDNSDYALQGNDFGKMRLLTAWQTPLQICVCLGRPLLAGYSYEKSSLHPVLWALHCESCKKLEVDPSSFL